MSTILAHMFYYRVAFVNCPALGIISPLFGSGISRPCLGRNTSERGQSITLFALMLPLMAVFILGLFDYMITNTRAMEAVAVADLSAHAGAQEVRLLPNGKILSDVDAGEEVAYDYFRVQAPSYVQFVDVVCGDSADRPFCRVTARVNSAGYLFASRPITVHAVGYLAWGITREKH
jgi:Putative Flp pilus-assembly TadE/G-like